MKKIKAIVLVLGLILVSTFGFASGKPVSEINTSKMENAVSKAVYFSAIVDIEYNQVYNIVYWDAYLDTTFSVNTWAYATIYVYTTLQGLVHYTVPFYFSAGTGNASAYTQISSGNVVSIDHWTVIYFPA